MTDYLELLLDQEDEEWTEQAGGPAVRRVGISTLRPAVLQTADGRKNGAGAEAFTPAESGAFGPDAGVEAGGTEVTGSIRRNLRSSAAERADEMDTAALKETAALREDAAADGAVLWDIAGAAHAGMRDAWPGREWLRPASVEAGEAETPGRTGGAALYDRLTRSRTAAGLAVQAAAPVRLLQTEAAPAQTGPGPAELDKIFQRDARRYDGGFSMF